MVRNLRQSNVLPLNPMRLWRKMTGPGELVHVTTKHMISKGASRMIPLSANTMSTIRFDVRPTGATEASERKS